MFMDSIDIRAKVDQYIRDYGIHHWTKAAQKDAELVALTNDINLDLPFAAKVLALMDDPICPNGSLKSFKSIRRGWGFCSKSCECALASKIEKARITSMARYGVNHHNQHPDAKDKLSKSNTKSDEETCLIEAKKRATNIDRYGVAHVMQLPEFSEKVKQTNRELYGEEFHLRRPDVKKQISEDTSIVNRRKETTLERHGTEYFSQKHILDDNLAILNNKELLEDFCSAYSFNSAAEQLGISSTTLLRYWKQHGLEVDRSSYEKEIASYLDSLEIDYERNTRGIVNGYELDFFIKSHDLVIEFNGLYWHSEKFKHRNYHRDKHKAITRAGYRVLMINEDEWLARPDVLKSKIRNLVNKSPRGIGARKLSIRVADPTLAKIFLEKHHIQGAPGLVKQAIAAYHNDEMVALMTFSVSRGTQNVELNRYCTDGKTYAGIFSRLFSINW
jgi:very-short-patch-repair endonuclease